LARLGEKYMTMKRPKTIIFLILTYSVGLFYFAKLFWAYSENSVFMLYQHFGIGWLYFVFAVIHILANLMILWFLFKPRPMGYWLAIGDLIFGYLQNVLFEELQLRDVAFAKSSYILNRQFMGRQIHQELIDRMFTRDFSIMYYIFTLIIIGF
jgi:hypothetical protein